MPIIIPDTNQPASEVNPSTTATPNTSSMLSLIQAAAGEMGLTVPVFVAGNAALDAVQLLALINAVGGELQREYDWQFLCKEYRFTTLYLSTTGTVTSGSTALTSLGSTTNLDSTYMVSGTGINQDTYVLSNDSASQVTLTQAATISGSGVSLTFGKTMYALPTDFDRQIDNTHYDKSKRWQMLGPETSQQWQFLKSSYISTGPRVRYRLMSGYFQIWPMLGSNEYCGFEYVSNAWVNTNTASPQKKFSADADTCVFPDRLMIDGLKMFYLRAKGFDYTSAEQQYMKQKSIAKANDSGSPILSMNPRLAEVLIGIDQIPDTGYGS